MFRLCLGFLLAIPERLLPVLCLQSTCKEISYVGLSRLDIQKDLRNHRAYHDTHSVSPMDTIISRFNSLPRKELSPSGIVKNHWHFSIRRVPLEPEGDVLFIVNPESHFVHTEGQIPPPQPGESEEARAVALAFLLVKAFASGLGGSTPGGTTEESLSIGRPWSWNTSTEEEARKMQAALSTLGINEECKHVGTASEEENRTANEDWQVFFSRLSDMFAGGGT